jgi:hypothetical protein
VPIALLSYAPGGKVINKTPHKPLKIKGVVKATFLPTHDIKEVTAYFINED